MKKIVVIFAAMAAVLSSCSKNELGSVSANDGKDIVLNISVSNPGADDTKALVKTEWVKDDQIKIWFDTNTGDTPDLVIKYDGSDWEGTPASTPKSSGSIKAVYNNFVIVSSKDTYTYTDNTLSFSIENWKFLTEIQVVVKGIPYYYDATYKLSCDKFTPVTRAGFTVGANYIAAARASKGDVVKGISNADGVAFVFATADYSSSSTDKKDFTFTLTDDTNGSEVTKVYKVNTAIVAKTNNATIKALTIDISKFAAPAATKGTAKRTGDIDVNWVQLWENGPKFAEYNVGASSAIDVGSTMTFTDATKAGAEYVWGANWCTPSKADMEHLVTAAKDQTDEKVKCEYVPVSDTYGFKFTGLTAGYTENSVFFPAEGGDSDYGRAVYWSGTAADGSKAWHMVLDYDEGDWYCGWNSYDQGDTFLVRPVFKN